jgi:hypothetical protein
MAGNGATRILAGTGYSVSGAGVQFRGGLFRRIAGEGEWHALSAGLPENVEVRAIAVHPQNSDVIYVGTQDGPYRSTDGGDRWERLGFPERGAVVWSLSIHPTRPNIMYAGLAPVALYRSEVAATRGASSPRRNRRRTARGLASTRALSGSPSIRADLTTSMPRWK